MERHGKFSQQCSDDLSNGGERKKTNCANFEAVKFRGIVKTRRNNFRSWKRERGTIKAPCELFGCKKWGLIREILPKASPNCSTFVLRKKLFIFLRVETIIKKQTARFYFSHSVSPRRLLNKSPDKKRARLETRQLPGSGTR